MCRIQEELERLEQQQASSRQGLEDIMQQALQVCITSWRMHIALSVDCEMEIRVKSAVALVEGQHVQLLRTLCL